MSATEDRHAAFFAHAERVRGEFLDLKLSEADTRSYLIDPVLAMLGYEGVSHLRREVPVPATKEFIDYELLVDGKPHVIVEAKGIRHAVTSQHAAQCVQYATVLGVRWCLITNGVVWALYDAHAKGPLEEKRVAEVRLDGDAATTERAWAVLSVFSRGAVAASTPLSTLLVERVLTDELASPDSPAVAALRRVVRKRFGERVTGGAIVDVLDHWRDRAAAPDAETESASSAAMTVPAPPASKSRRSDRKPRSKSGGAGTRVTIPDLIDAGLLPPDAVLEARVHDISHVARIRDGMIEYEGRRFATPSAASMALRQTKSWNGWVDWHYKGQLLADLREQFRRAASTGSAAPASRLGDGAPEAPS